MATRRHLRAVLLLLVVGLFALGSSARGSRAKDAVRLENIQALTFQKGKPTSHRRVQPLPQLKCVGGSAKGLFEPETVRCKNSGSSYSTADIEWTCKASLPHEFKLGSTEVVCEGYDSPEDDYILKGSCGLEYRLILTEAGEKKYGKPNWWGGRSGGQQHVSGRRDDGRHQNALVSDSTAGFIFWLIFVVVLIFIVVKATSSGNQAGPRRPPRRHYGGGGGPDDDDDDPPPPYTRGSGNYRKSEARGADRGWQPGFWTGAAAGAAGGYYAGSRAQNRQQQRSSWFDSDAASYYEPGESSRQGSSISYGSAGSSSSRYDSTGFGGTRRR